MDPAAARLRKALMMVDYRCDGEGAKLIHSHMFAAYNEPVDIFPPPFTIFEQRKSA